LSICLSGCFTSETTGFDLNEIFLKSSYRKNFILIHVGFIYLGMNLKHNFHELSQKQLIIKILVHDTKYISIHELRHFKHILSVWFIFN